MVQINRSINICVIEEGRVVGHKDIQEDAKESRQSKMEEEGSRRSKIIRCEGIESHHVRNLSLYRERMIIYEAERIKIRKGGKIEKNQKESINENVLVQNHVLLTFFLFRISCLIDGVESIEDEK